MYERVHKRVCGCVYECVNKNVSYEYKCKYVFKNVCL